MSQPLTIIYIGSAVALWASRVWIPARGPYPDPAPLLSPTSLHYYTLSYLYYQNKGKNTRHLYSIVTSEPSYDSFKIMADLL